MIKGLRLGFEPIDLCVSSDYFVVLGRDSCVLTSLHDLDRSLGALKLPKCWKFRGVTMSWDSKHVFIVGHEDLEDKLHDSKGALFTRCQSVIDGEVDISYDVETVLDLYQAPFGGIAMSK